MRVLHAATELQPGPRKVCVAIGVFDGVHLGHQQVIRQTLAEKLRKPKLAKGVAKRGRPKKQA